MKGSIARQDRLSFILYLGETSYIHTVPFTVSALYSYLFNDWALVIWFAQIFPFSNRRWHALEEQPKTNNKINKIIHKKNKSWKIERQNYRRGLICKAHRTEARRRQARTEWWWQNWVWEHGEGESDVKNRSPTQALRTVGRLVNADLLMHKLLVI